MSKRFRVEQDANGTWGILDTMAVNFPVIEPFAPYDFTKGTAHKWVHLIHEHAISLNLGKMSREEFSWEDFRPRVKR